jgi:hypothetical protein
VTNVPESFSCEECGKSFPTEGDMRQHTEAMHGTQSVSGYKQTEGPVKDDEPAVVPPNRPI